ncbi:hypothetical protein CWATWH0402_5131 [Crocosphaera watsonii WH 0402]|uniref:Uncharacterized protein n=2 Tax=Crocosphaera watsonii TaxID=263511 RepID=T2JQP7_CROWT|nr:hypothetical protein CWATWH0005_4566 [Crocosphaera watsonii WH 0005]CCQ67359.1 hypothetical protein CWATWH0402_5131 [Crocosphaera watsonii WH 0402]
MFENLTHFRHNISIKFGHTKLYHRFNTGGDWGDWGRLGETGGAKH